VNPEGIHASPRIYSVWVGGGEVNDYYLTWGQAITVARMWADSGYDEVAIGSRDDETWFHRVEVSA